MRRSASVIKLEVTMVGGSAGVVLPKEVLARLKVEQGDAEAVETMLALAAGEVEETALGDWFRANLAVLPAS